MGPSFAWGKHATWKLPQFQLVHYRWILPYSALVGAMLVIGGDMVARVIIRPQELPVGVMMGILGAPFFIYLARWKVKS
jgi:iron complex transport system permease protein